MADYSFPFGQALELFLSCFTGTISAKINNLQQQLQRTDIISQPSNTQQVQKLNNLESQAWLYKGILERLGAETSTNHEKIAKTLEALEYKRDEILKELEPRRPQSYRILAKIQNFTRDLLASQAKKDYEQLEKIVINLALFATSRQPSNIILSDVINELATEIARNSNQISPYRLRLAYKLDELMKAISSRLILDSNSSETDSSYQSLVNEVRSQINLKRIQATTEYARKKELEVASLESEKSQLNIQRLELQQQYQSLYQNYQQNQKEIADLRKKLEDLSKTNQSNIKLIATQADISVQEWEQISNQSDYVKVTGHSKQNGTWVNEYYRRRPGKKTSK